MALLATGIVIVGVGVVAVGSWLYDTIVNWISSFEKSPSAYINWNDCDKNHVMRGSGDGHVKGFKKLGFDPKDPNNWNKLLVYLKLTVDAYDAVLSWRNIIHTKHLRKFHCINLDGSCTAFVLLSNQNLDIKRKGRFKYTLKLQWIRT